MQAADHERPVGEAPIARRWAALAVLAGVIGAAPAVAQDTHGMMVPPDDGAPTDPILSEQPTRFVAGSVAVAGTVEYARAPFVQVFDRAGEIQVVPLLDDVVLLDLGASYAVHERIAVRVALPLVVASGGLESVGGPTLADAAVRVPVTILLPRPDGTGFGLGVVPHLRVPIGNTDRFLGDGRVGGGADLVVGYATPRVAVSATGGVEGRDFRTFDDLSPRPLLGVAGSVAWLPVPSFGVHTEARALVPIGRRVVPVEVLVGARGAHRSGAFWTAGVARGLTRGVGAASVRAFVGFGWASALRVADVAPEVPWSVRVTTRFDEPIAGAVVRAGEAVLGRTDPAGDLVISGVRWDTLVVAHDGYVPATVDRPSEGTTVAVALEWEPVPVVAWVQGPDGAALAPTARLVGEREVPVSVSAQGRVALEAPVGTWSLEFEAPGMGAQARSVVVNPGDPPVVTTAVMAPGGGEATLALSITDGEGHPLDGVHVRVDGQPLGTTSTGGTLEVAGLVAGPHDVEVIADAFQALELADTVLDPGRTAIPVTLRRQPGSVRVRVRGPDGVVPDATVRFSGPSRLPPVPLGADGERILQLRPGAWSALVLSPAYGVQTRDLLVPAYTTALTEVDVLLQPIEGGAAELVLHVHDPDGAPVDAEIRLDGRSFGTSSSGGTLILPQLDEGPRTLEVRGDRFRPLDPIPLFLVRGVQEHHVTLEWLPGTVHVVARTPTSEVSDGVARFRGPGELAPVDLGPDGRAYVRLEPGAWQALVASAAHGLKRADVEVPPDHASLIVADVLFPAAERGAGALAVTVRDPLGAPVDGAVVSLDGTVLGTTSTAGTLSLTELSEGTRVLSAEAALFRPVTREVALTGTQQVDLTLAWAAGAVKVVTRTAAGPVTDAVVRFASADDVRSAVRVDARGERLVALAPGRWQALVSSPTHGLQQRGFTIDAADGLTTVEFVMDVVDAGGTQVLVRVVDPDGNPIPGAEVVLAGAPRGTTGDGGALLVDDAPAGATALEVRAADFAPARTDGVEVRAGAQERLVRLEWVRTPVGVTVRDASGAPIAAADVAVDGPEDLPPTLTDAEGRASLSLRPGKWLVLASSPTLGTLSVALVVRPGDPPHAVVFNLEEARVDVTSTEVVIRERVQFDHDQATLRPESGRILAEVAATLLSHGEIVRVEVQGHTDTTGGVAYNLDLSRRRAEAVVAALADLGVPPERMVAKGFGPTRPIDDNGTEEGRARNRRVQFDIVE